MMTYNCMIIILSNCYLKYITDIVVYAFIKLVRPAGLEPTPQASETCTLSS